MNRARRRFASFYLAAAGAAFLVSGPVLGDEQPGFCPVEGGRLRYEVAGSGPAVVLMHDGLVDLRVWDGVWGELAKSFRVVRYDRRGYGESPAPAEPFLPRDDLRRVMDCAGVPVATLVASSAGSDLALRTAVAFPSRVERLVLIGPVVSGLGFSK
ncbi:MAG: alpha/beta hydrolase, partial [Acidobacteria bacterium]|nr:alpha/beta hydrolase [Acidobacteriota bacterium]